ncbi:MAG: NAD(P)-binding protein [Gammaproteobacteria bacterium]|nr:NAD(P)-binding protein [Gammaproteobacteria bacterium]
MAISLAAGSALSPLQAAARGLLAPDALGPDYYPPRLTGMRGSHAGSFEVAHAVGREGRRYEPPAEQTDPTYDLVVVGGGLSGLAAAWFFRETAGREARILVLDNHDDFGGHAKQVEFEVDGRRLISYGGSQTLEQGDIPPAAKRLLHAVGFDAAAFEKYFDRAFYQKYLQPGIYFDAERYGESKLVRSPLGTLADLVGVERSQEDAAMIAEFPVSEAAKRQLTGLFTATPESVYPELSGEGALRKMLTQSYETFAREEHGLGDEACGVVRDYLKGPGTQLGLDSVNVLTGNLFNGLPIPGLTGLGDDVLQMLGLGPSASPSQPYIHHFPGGNSGIARLIVRDLIPDVAPGGTQEDMVLARFDYGRLDAAGSPVRIRLNSTAVDVRHGADGKVVDVTYVQGGAAYRVRGSHCVMACYNHVLPWICPEMGEEQKTALRYASKTPFAYTQVALRNWRAIEKSGHGMVYSLGAFVSEFWLDFPVSMGGYEYPKDPDGPTVVTAYPIETPDRSGLSPREQFRVGRAAMLARPFAEYEAAILSQLDKVWGPYGMDAARDVAAITVNRWPHGYAYTYDPLWDPREYDAFADTGPHVAGRARMHRVSIANSDAGAMALVQTAMDQAHRAVAEQLAIAG